MCACLMYNAADEDSSFSFQKWYFKTSDRYYEFGAVVNKDARRLCMHV